MRLSVRGTCGSGKSTLAKAVATRLNISYVELDSLHHLPGWQERPTDDMRQLVEQALRGDEWVVEGNYAKVRDLVDPRAETVVWLDYPFGLIFWRLICRTLRRCLRGEECCNGNRESLRRSLSRDGILWWMITSFHRRRRQCDELFAQPLPEGTTRHRFRHPREAQKWLDGL